jgi:hypothetical protein
MKLIVQISIMALIIFLFIGTVLIVSGSHESIPGATDIPLIARCKLIYFDTRLQPVNTLVLACPRMDYFRLWPLPFQHPWFEHPWHKNPDAINV